MSVTPSSPCCCHAPGTCSRYPRSEHQHRCTPRGVDMGHCYGDDFEQNWCCRSPFATPVTIVCVYCGVNPVDSITGVLTCDDCRWIGAGA